MFLSFVSCSSKLIEPEEEVWKPLIITSWLSPGLVLVSEVGGGQVCRIEPLTYGIRCYLWVECVRIELNCRTPSWYPENCWCWEPTPTNTHFVIGPRNLKDGVKGLSRDWRVDLMSLKRHTHFLWVNFLLNKPFINNISFVAVVQSLSRVWLCAALWTAAHKSSLSFTISQSLLKLMSIDSVMISNHLILCHPLLLLPSIFPSIRVFSSESALCIRWPKY